MDSNSAARPGAILRRKREMHKPCCRRPQGDPSSPGRQIGDIRTLSRCASCGCGAGLSRCRVRRNRASGEGTRRGVVGPDVQAQTVESGVACLRPRPRQQAAADTRTTALASTASAFRNMLPRSCSCSMALMCSVGRPAPADSCHGRETQRETRWRGSARFHRSTRRPGNSCDGRSAPRAVMNGTTSSNRNSYRPPPATRTNPHVQGVAAARCTGSPSSFRRRSRPRTG